MFDLIPNAKTRNIIGQLPLSELIDFIKNPSTVSKLSVDTARTFEKGSKEYNSIKVSLPCFVPNYSHNSHVRAETAQKPTGYLYIDIDEKVSVDFSYYAFVAAAWKSLSGIGNSLLVAVENMPKAGCQKSQIEEAVEQVCTTMSIPFDRAAISRDRIVALAYDNNPYYNPNHSSFTLITKEEVNKKSNPVVIEKINDKGIRLRVNQTFSDDKLRLSNLDEVKGDIKFEDDEVYKSFLGNKINYADIFLSKNIKSGERNSRIFKIASQIYGLNPNADKNLIFNFMLKVNSISCQEPLESDEVLDICTKVLSREANLYSNKSRAFIYNDNLNLTAKERVTIAVRETNKYRATITDTKIGSVLDSWDFNEMGKVTYNKIAEYSGINRSTVASRGKKLKDRIKKMNENFVK